MFNSFKRHHFVKGNHEVDLISKLDNLHLNNQG